MLFCPSEEIQCLISAILVAGGASEVQRGFARGMPYSKMILLGESLCHIGRIISESLGICCQESIKLCPSSLSALLSSFLLTERCWRYTLKNDRSSALVHNCNVAMHCLSCVCSISRMRWQADIKILRKKLILNGIEKPLRCLVRDSVLPQQSNGRGKVLASTVTSSSVSFSSSTPFSLLFGESADGACKLDGFGALYRLVCSLECSLACGLVCSLACRLACRLAMDCHDCKAGGTTAWREW